VKKWEAGKREREINECREEIENFISTQLDALNAGLQMDNQPQISRSEMMSLIR
jgi:hypothetical protein